MNEFLTFLRNLNLVFFNSENEYDVAFEDCLVTNRLCIKDFLDQPLVDTLCISFQGFFLKFLFHFNRSIILNYNRISESLGKYIIFNGERKNINGIIVTIKKKSHITTKTFQRHVFLSSETVEENLSPVKQKNKPKLIVKMLDHNHNIEQNEKTIEVVEPKKLENIAVPGRVVDVETLTDKISNFKVTPNNENNPKEQEEKRYFLRVRPTKKELFKSA